jgi:hypothetical protein
MLRDLGSVCLGKCELYFFHEFMICHCLSPFSSGRRILRTV